MERLKLKPTHKPVRNYYEQLRQYAAIGVAHEGAVRSAFQSLLESCGNTFGWTLVGEWPIKGPNGKVLRVDGALVDEFRLTHGFWEAKDTQDDLAKEVKKKIDLGYPQNNILFQSPGRAILWQDGRRIVDADITDPNSLLQVVTRFFDYAPPEYEQWNDAVAHFQAQVPELGRSLAEIIKQEEQSNQRFRQAFDDFFAVCRQSINPNLSKEAVEEMLIQHLLTERIFRTVFNNPDFTRRNAIAIEIEKVIDALTSKAFSRENFLQRLDRFYKAIESAARLIDDFSQKQLFLNTVYEKFFQGFSVKVADTHGIVYTPPPIVEFMVHSVQNILRTDFGKSFSSADVHILDPFVGTGNFIVHIMQEIKKTTLDLKYDSELHCNEVMLLPYYVASMNIEREFYELTGKYEMFPGICLVDTFELAEDSQISFFTAENTARVERQKRSPIKVIIGNPPYNAKQLNENDVNKNRRYKAMQKLISTSYAKDSKATLVNTLSDPYVKAIRWASDRIGAEGIVAFVTNNSFVNEIAFDGMRKHLAQSFDEIYILNLGGNVRKNPKLSGSTHNVFGIQIGVSINLFVRRDCKRELRNPATIYYASTGEFWRKEEKYKFLEEAKDRTRINWRIIKPDQNHNWLTEFLRPDFASFIPVGSRTAKQARARSVETIFKEFGLGIKTGRDNTVYDFNDQKLLSRVTSFAEVFNGEVQRYRRKGRPKDVDSFVDYREIKWSRNLKRFLTNSRTITIDTDELTDSLYRPFVRKRLYFGEILIDELGRNKYFFPTARKDANVALCATGVGAERPFATLMCDVVPDLNFFGPGSVPQWFPFYTYSDDTNTRRENITDWALEEFRLHYKDSSLTKWNIFHYVYALLHHPLYRDLYAANLKRELPRIPYVPDFRAFAEIGQRLADLHVNYDQQPEYPLEKIEAPNKTLDWLAERMKVSRDKHSLIYNEFLTLQGIPSEVLEYRLGNRSALEWIIDQYQVSTDKGSGITSDPNRIDDPQYIVRLIGQVVTVSLETVRLVQVLKSKPLQ
jgi:predicted helicase